MYPFVTVVPVLSANVLGLVQLLLHVSGAKSSNPLQDEAMLAARSAR